MLVAKGNNIAFIDGANLHNGIKSQGWDLDYVRFRVWLRERYGVSKAYIFLGLVPKYTSLYNSLQNSGYDLVFKQTTYDGAGKVKGNCDADLVVEVMRNAYEGSFDQAVIVSSDGDYASLIGFLLPRKQLRVLLSPAAPKQCSILLKRTGARITFLSEFETILAKNEKAPDADRTA